jgi:hypothetical protein
MKDEIARMFEGNPNNVKATSQEVIDVVYGEGRPIVTIYTGEKYAQWHDEFTQNAASIPDLKPLLRLLIDQGYKMNLD